MGGTSVAPPIFAGAFALANNDLGTSAAGRIHATPAGLSAITSESYANKCSTYLCTAGDSLSFGTQGGTYNGITGAGTPNGISAF